jgi:hypothetical protein
MSASLSRADFLLGVGTHNYGQEVSKNYQALKEAGVNTIRDDLNWRGVEKVKGQLAMPAKMAAYVGTLARMQVAPLVVLDYGNPLYDDGGKPVSDHYIQAFANYARFVAGSLRDQVGLFEIWNEWDNSKTPNSPESYLKLVKGVAPEIRSGNGKSLVLAGSANIYDGWNVNLVKLGALRYVDGISVHPYLHCERDNSPEAWIKGLGQFSARLQKANGGREVPLYVTEMGWPSNSGACGTPPEKVALYLSRALLLVRTVPAIRGFWWYDLKNDGQRPEEIEDNFGLLGFDYAPKPAFAAFKDLAPIVREGRRFQRLNSLFGVALIEIENKDGARLFAIWSETGMPFKADISMLRRKGEAPRMLKVGSSRYVELAPTNNRIELLVDGTPRILTGLDRMSVEKQVW